MTRSRRANGPKPSTTTRSSPRAARARGRFGVRVAAFAVLAAASLSAAALVWPKAPAVDASAQKVTVDMGGFTPAVITARAGQTVRVQLVNPDSAYHTDGGGWHELAIPDLGIDAKVAPRSTSTIEIPAPGTPGTYVFYCDICCGGKENPEMQGVLKVTA